MTDRELLELAAKAAGICGHYACHHPKFDNDWEELGIWFVDKNDCTSCWNPLKDDGDALRLAVNLKLDVSFGNRYYFDEGPMTFCGTYWSSGESATFKRFVSHGSDPYAATRRAIVRAAAEIGEEMK